MKRGHDECVDNIKRRCIERLSVKRKLSFYPNEEKRTKTDYHQGLMDGKKMTEEACYYFFTYSYNSLIQREVDQAVEEIKQHYENLLIELETKGYQSIWVY